MNAPGTPESGPQPGRGAGSRRGIGPWLAVLGIVAAAAVLRFWALSDSGMYTLDEGRYLLDSLSKHYELRMLVLLAQGKLEELGGGAPFSLADFLTRQHAELAAHGLLWPKTLFYYATGAVMFGAGFAPWAGNAVEALFGALMVGALFLFVRSVASPRAALIAAALLAVSAFHLHQSRSSYPQCLPAFLVVLGFWAQAGWRPGRTGLARLLAAGFLVGLGFWGTYQSLVVAPALGLLLLFASLEAQGWPRRVAACCMGGVALAAGFAGAVVVAEASTYPFFLLFRSAALDYPHPTFLQLQWPRVAFHTNVDAHWSGLVLFPYLLSLFEGPAFLVAACMLLLGGAWASRRLPGGETNRRAVLWLGAALLATWWVVGVKGMPAARPYIFVQPFLYGLVAVAADRLLRVAGPRRRARAAATAGLLAVALASSALNAAEVIAFRPAYPRAAEWLRQQGIGRVAAVYPPLLRCYLEPAGIEVVNLDMALVTGEEPPPVFVADPTRLHYGWYPSQVEYLPEDAVEIAAFHHRAGRKLIECEYLPPFARPLDGIRYVRALDLDRATAVRVFDVGATGYHVSDERRFAKDPVLFELR